MKKRHIVSLPPDVFEALEVYKKKLEGELKLRLTFGQTIFHLLNKDTK